MTYSDNRILLSNQREGQATRFRAWIVVLVSLGAILFQVYVPRHVEFLRFLELPLLITIYFALVRRNQISGLLVGAVVGLAQDSLTEHPLGLFGIIKTLVGYFAASIGVRLDVDHPLIRLLLGFFFYVFHQVMVWVMTRALLGQSMNLNLAGVAVEGVLNAIVGVALFLFLDRLRERA
jgi:rod shape-determining protein MreD